MTPEEIHAAAEAVKDAAQPRTWQLGRKLFEDGRVERIADRGAEEQVFKVWAPGRPVAPTATLYVEDEEWDCDCPSRLDVCEHVTAAVHALRAGPQLEQGPGAATGPTLGYRLARRRGGLTLARVWVEATGERPAAERLSARASGVQGGFSPREHDLKIDQLLAATDGKLLMTETLPSLFGWLEKSDDVQLDGDVVRISAAAPRHRAKVTRDGDAFVLRIESAVGLDGARAQASVVADGVIRIADTLHPLTHLRLVGAQLEKLPLERRFEGDEVLKLVGEWLPKLRKGMDFDASEVELPRLVEGCEVQPELAVRVRGDAIELGAQIVYVDPSGDSVLARVQGETLVATGSRWPQRERKAEARARRRLEHRFDLAPGEVRVERGQGAEALAARLRGYDGRLRGRAQLERFGSPLAPRMRRDEHGTLHVEFAAGDVVVEAEDALRAWANGDQGIALPGGGWAALPQAFIEANEQRLLDFVAARQPGKELPAHLAGTVAELCEALEHPLPPEFDRLRPLLADLEGLEGLPAAELPQDLRAQLRAYQRRGVDWLAFGQRAGLGAMLCDDMGLGKTLQTLCVLRGESLVVAPTSLLHNWAKEAARFRPDLDVVVYHGAGRALPAPREASDARDRVVVTSYGVMRLDLESLQARAWDNLVLDEAQTIKNPDSQVARAAFELEASFKMTLSGTPVENRLDELWSQAHFTNPGMLGGREAFKDAYARPIAAGDSRRAEALRAKLKPVLLRRLKTEVAPELPPRIEVTVHCALNDEERALYDGLRTQAQLEVESMLEGGKSVLSALETLLRLRQAACHRGLVPGQSADDSAKLRRLRAELDEAVAAGHKALVFSQWTSLLDLVEPSLKRIGVDYCRLDGSTRDRGAVVDTFSAPDGPPVMLLSLMAGGTGLNLVAADHVYFLDPWWNPAVEAQAADRAHRIGQDKPVVIHRLVARDTVDERILALQAKKRALADAVVADGDTSLSREDLLGLLA